MPVGKKYGGRKAGTPNKTTKEIREILTPIITKYVSGEGISKFSRTLENDLATMEPEERAKVIVNLIPYIAPKLASVEVKPQGEIKTLKDELDELENS